MYQIKRKSILVSFKTGQSTESLGPHPVFATTDFHSFMAAVSSSTDFPSLQSGPASGSTVSMKHSSSVHLIQSPPSFNSPGFGPGAGVLVKNVTLSPRLK